MSVIAVDWSSGEAWERACPISAGKGESGDVADIVGVLAEFNVGADDFESVRGRVEVTAGLRRGSKGGGVDVGAVDMADCAGSAVDPDTGDIDEGAGDSTVGPPATNTRLDVTTDAGATSRVVLNRVDGDSASVLEGRYDDLEGLGCPDPSSDG